MAKQTLAVQSIQDQLNASLAEAAPVLKNVIIGIQNILPGAMRLISMMEYIIPVLVALKAAMWTLSIAQLFNAKATIAQLWPYMAITAASRH